MLWPWRTPFLWYQNIHVNSKINLHYKKICQSVKKLGHIHILNYTKIYNFFFFFLTYLSFFIQKWNLKSINLGHLYICLKMNSIYFAPNIYSKSSLWFMSNTWTYIDFVQLMFNIFIIVYKVLYMSNISQTKVSMFLWL